MSNTIIERDIVREDGCLVDRLACGCESGCIDGAMCETATELWDHWFEDHMRFDQLPMDHYKRRPRTYRLSSVAWDGHYEVRP